MIVLLLILKSKLKDHIKVLIQKKLDYNLSEIDDLYVDTLITKNKKYNK